MGEETIAASAYFAKGIVWVFFGILGYKTAQHFRKKKQKGVIK